MESIYPKKTLWVVAIQKCLVDEKGKEKKTKETFLVEASNTESIQKIIASEMPYTDDWEIISINKSNIIGLILEEL